LGQEWGLDILYERFDRQVNAWFDYYDNVRPSTAGDNFATAGAVRRTLS